ncbi:type III restriction-modification system endonuclease [Haemophilus influenzae]|uniref:type III restriction-modification system endonuclease n=1 Tax=Haemophilus influenzae TaxID=727 RepID=UPI000E3434A3|nr:type III restriction-modification system endonuclease [Haemophilus influenzae]MCK8932681.1 type III restriction-modification system endonuclease [Haemophilus influenzae]RFO66166.1 type III restriction-modification system endonuclease [Haemophilus influenzae]RFO70613.1 type III restriction-modification system endonuclease [Haemophilus influenzae]
MAGFTYEKNLPHQERAIESVLAVFDLVHLNTKVQNDENPLIEFAGSLKTDNLQKIQQANNVADIALSHSNVLDISMETGTGKTYTYTKTMFELNRELGVFKFIVVVPTLSIKAGTKNFLQSTSLAEHFRKDFAGQYGETEIELYVVESQKNKAKKAFMPSEIVRFVQAEDKQKIHVLLINAGMINSDTMAGKDKGNDGSRLIKDKFSVPFEALASTNPFVIIDEPHKFPTSKKTWENIQKFNAQFILRYGATFNNQFENLLYRLSAIDAFNDDLVKGIRAFTEQIDGDNGERIKLIDLDGKEATFILDKQAFKLSKGENLNRIHQAIRDLFVSEMNKSVLVLSNGIELKKGDTINPYSYSDTVRDKMMRDAIRKHFVLEKELLTRNGGRIKPLTLFFIDEIAGYRDEKNQLSGSLKTVFEQMVKAELEHRLQTENDEFLRQYWQTALNDIAKTHGGYFSQDNSDKDDKIEQEVNEILHDKETLLSLANPRRFVFSKWTLREGWDNPNVFQICKLRSSGSETSKLQEVGRGLRLPVNEYMARVKDHAFFLNYFVDNSETNFVEKLINEVNSAVVKPIVFTALTDELIKKIQTAYPDVSKKQIRNQLADLTDDDDVFLENGFAETKKLFPKAFESSGSLKNGKIKGSGEKVEKVKMRIAKYDELKALWETINQKALLQYKIKDEDEFLSLFIRYLKENTDKFTATGIRTVQNKIRVDNGLLSATETRSLNDEVFEPINTLNYREFLLKLSQTALIQMQTLHKAFFALRDVLKISKFLNERTIHTIKAGFDRWLLFNSFNAFEVGFSRVGGSVHPTKFTDNQGNALAEVNASDLGTQFDSGSPLAEFLFESVFFDSELEHANITKNQVKEVIVFTKIPKNSIKIPVAGGGTYSPDFAYIIKTSSGDRLNLIVESKNVPDNQSLRSEEQQKIKHAEKLFNLVASDMKLVFKTQFEKDEIVNIIKNAQKQR